MTHPIIILIANVFIIAGCTGLLDPDEPGNLVPKTVAKDPLLPSIEINCTLLHAEAFGDIHNPIIIFMHGGSPMHVNLGLGYRF